jgi:hypothetical protein
MTIPTGPAIGSSIESSSGHSGLAGHRDIDSGRIANLDTGVTEELGKVIRTANIKPE